MDRDTSLRPQRRTALIARELARYQIDIAALSETRLAEEGSVAEPKGGYTFFWKGKAKDEERIHGVGLAIKTSLLSKLPNLPSSVNERLMKLRFPLNRSRHVTLISAYAPTLTSSDEVKEAFYEELSTLVKDTPSSDKLILLGDFNARVGADCRSWKGVLGPHGTGKLNSNGLMLLSFCAESHLTITNTLFRQADKYKTSWMHPRSKQWHLIDFAICRQRDIRDIRITRAMRGAECWTDHRLIRSILSLHIAPTHRKTPKVIRPAFNVAKLECSQRRSEFADDLDGRLTSHGPLTGCPTQKWEQFRSLLSESATNTIGHRKRVHRDWFDENDENIKALLDAKQKAFVEWQNAPSSISKRDKFKHLQRQAQTSLRKMQDEWWERKADEVQRYADTQNSKLFFSAIKEVYGPPKPCTAPLLSADGSTLLKEKTSINARWREHFSNLLNRPSAVAPQALDLIPQKNTVHCLDLPPTMDEVLRAINKTSSGEAPGIDGIPAELFKSAGSVALETFHSLLTSIWEKEELPKDFRDATVVSLYKNKGSRTDCGNYRGISLLSIAGKILARILLNRMIKHISEGNLPETQCGFRPHRSTMDMIFTVRQVQEKCLEQNMDLYVIFIDLTKAFDTVNREALWIILSKLGCPDKFVNLIRQFHDNMTGQVLSNGEVSEPFNITNGVKQGCVLAPVLFNLFFTCVLSHAIKDLDLGVYLRYRLDGSLFDLRRLNAKTKVVERMIMEALFADDCALMAHKETDLQLIANRFAEASRLFGLTISLGKTEVLFQPAPTSIAAPPSISIEGTPLKTVDDFKYLGSTISNDGSLDKEINTRICKASQALGRLRARVLNQHNIQLCTKLTVYRAIVLTSLLYGCETWTVYRRHLKQLEKFHTKSLRSIMSIRWQDRVTNLEVLDRAKMTSIEAMVLKARLRWVGHVIRMDDHRLPKQLLYCELSSGKRSQGRPRMRFKDCVKSSLKETGVPPNQLELRAADRSGWRAITTQAENNFERKRRQDMVDARRRRKESAAEPANAGHFPCPRCTRVCRSGIGLYSHLRSHTRTGPNT